MAPRSSHDPATPARLPARDERPAATGADDIAELLAQAGAAAGRAQWEAVALLSARAGELASQHVRVTLPPPGGAKQKGRATARHSSSLATGLRMLELFDTIGTTWRLADIAEHLTLSRPTTHRYLTTLVALGYLEQDGGRRYRRARAG